MKLELTHAALEDLHAISQYTLEHWGVVQESRYMDQFWLRFENLLNEPDRYRSREDLFPGCQLALEGKHVILLV